jgi:hypothetical protein
MADTLGELTSALQTYIVSPLNAFGAGGFVFDAQSESQADLSADITDHYTENNQALQDHIAIRPKRITLRGYVGELVYDTAGTPPSTLQTVTQKLTTITAFLPQVSAAATQAQAAISGVNSAGGTLQSLAAAVPAAANIYGLVQNAIGISSGTEKKQQAAYQYFASCMNTGILMGLQTPWEFLTNMAIERIVAIQAEDSIFITDFSVTFKQIRIASTQTTLTPLGGTGGIASNPQNAQGATAAQLSSTVNGGNCPGVTLPTATLPTSYSEFSGPASLNSPPFNQVF